MKKKIWLLGLCLMGFLTACQPKLNLYQKQFIGSFDTICQIQGYAVSRSEFEQHFAFIQDRLEFYSRHYDIYRQYEGITNLADVNQLAGKAPLKVNPVILDLLKLGKEMYYQTEGNVNIAMGSVLKIWHQYRQQGMKNPAMAKLPPREDLLLAGQHMDIEDIILDEKAQTVFLRDEKMSLDVGALAKGYAVEQVAKEMENKGLTGYLINVGGNIRAVGRKANQELWRVGIQNPEPGSENEYLEVIGLENQSLVTSGSYQRFYRVDEKNYHHIIDPVTLMPGERFLSVSIIGKGEGQEDAISTAVFNMPLEKGEEWLEQRPDLAAIWILKDGSRVYSKRAELYMIE